MRELLLSLPLDLLPRGRLQAMPFHIGRFRIGLNHPQPLQTVPLLPQVVIRKLQQRAPRPTTPSPPPLACTVRLFRFVQGR